MSYSPNFINNIATGTVSSTRKVARNYTNGSGLTQPQATPVSTLTSGLVTTVDVSSQTSVDRFVGLYNQSTPNGASGLVLDSGLMENITTSFSVGDPVYISTSGTLTNVTPSIGVGGFLAGYYVVFVGIIVKNEFNSLQKDLKILIQKAGIL